jgi:hypothetical protein
MDDPNAPAAPIEIDGPRILRHLVGTDYFERPHYAYGVFLASKIAVHCGIETITLVEMGVAHGRGLYDLCVIAAHFHALLKLNYRIFGFDGGRGMPRPQSHRDHPEIWQEHQFGMLGMEARIRSITGLTDLIIGDVGETVPRFVRDRLGPAAPLGFVALDLDYYSSTRDALGLFDGPALGYLPVVPTYVDDVNDLVSMHDGAGAAGAIAEFNAGRDLRKLQWKLARPSKPRQYWHRKYWFGQILDHPVRDGRARVHPFQISVEDC